MMNPSLIDLYLAELQLLLGRRSERTRRFLREVADHLADAVSDSVGRGVPPMEAESEAIDSFGAPRTVARQIAPELTDDGVRTTFSALHRPRLTAWLRAIGEWRPALPLVTPAPVPVATGPARARMRRG